MFRVNLTDLDRRGTIAVEGEIPAEDPIWGEDSAEAPAGAVEVELALTATPTGQVVARGFLRAGLSRNCRRCLKDVHVEVDEDLTLVWSVPDELQSADDEGEIRTLDPTSNELDLREAIREEFLLARPRFVLCSTDCKGLCPVCGIDRNEDTCNCTLKEPDPRWDALRALKTE